MSFGLKKFITGKSIPDKSFEDDASIDLSLLKLMDTNTLGAAREAVWNNIGEFEAALQQVARLPEQFRLMMTPVENAVSTMALLRNRLENSESALAEDAQRLTDLAQDKAHLTEELNQLKTALKLEEATTASLRQQNAAAEASHLQLQQDHATLQSTVNRMEPQIRELTSLRDALQTELGDLRQAKDHADKTISELHTELESAIDKISDRNNFLSNLQVMNERLRERLENSGKSISELECAVTQLGEKYNTVKTELSHERKLSATLRIENLQLRKDSEESRSQAESEIETLQSRRHFLDQALADSRARLAEENRQLSQARLERVERDREIGRMKLSLEALQRESNELRAQLNAATTSLSATGQLLSSEIENRHRLELELDMLRNENSTLHIKNKGLGENARLSELAHEDALQKLQSRLAKLSAENDQLRAVVRVANDHDDSNAIKTA